MENSSHSFSNYNYDGFNRTTKVETFDGNIQINRYDAEGLRYEMMENNNLVQFIFNQNREVIAEQETEWTSYIRGSTLLASSAEHARTYYHYASDEMSSVTHIVDDEKVLNEYEYDAWGEVISEKETVSNRFKFNGQQLDPITQQYYLRARFYNPVIARFTQEDTYRGDGLNLYAYCRNNPVYYVDPTGNARNCVKEAYDEIRAANPGMSATQAHALAMEQAGVQSKLKNSDNSNDGVNQPKKPKADGDNDVGLSNRGYKPQPGERTFEGYVNGNVPHNKETKLYTNSPDFNTNPREDGHFKRYGTEPNQHGIAGTHVHQPQRNVNPNNGMITGKPGSKTKQNGVGSPNAKDVKQLYEYFNNGKYHR